MRQRDDWHLTDVIAYEHGRGDPFAAAVRGTRMPMVITDPSQHDNPIVFCNEAFQALSGYARHEIIGKNCRFLQGPETDKSAVAKVREAIEAGRDIEIDLLNYRKDGSQFWNALYLSPVRNSEGNVQFFFASQLDVTERVDAQKLILEQKMRVEHEVGLRTADLRAALEAKTILLHEVDHRVKNNLTMIGSLLRLQARTISHPEVSSKLEAMLERVDALATVHRQLYQSEDVSRFDIGAFTRSLVDDVIGISGRSDIEVNLSVERIDVSSNKADSIGLILNELVTNAVKHAFADGRGGRLDVSVERVGGMASVEISDDGPGLGARQPEKSGLGHILVDRLSRQIGGRIAWSDNTTGTRARLLFPLEDER